MSSEEKETLVKRLLVNNVSYRSINYAVRHKFGDGIGMTRIKELKDNLTPEEIDRIRSTLPPDPLPSDSTQIIQKELIRQKQAIKQLLALFTACAIQLRAKIPIEKSFWNTKIKEILDLELIDSFQEDQS